MFALIQKDGGLPTVVNEHSDTFPDFILSGYDIIKEGSRKEMEEEYETLIVEFASIED